MKVRVERKHWVLLALAAGAPNGFTPIQLQKSVFLIGKDLKLRKTFYSFSPYDYGPFTPEIYADAEELEVEGLVNISFLRFSGWREYSATQEGLEKANEILEENPPELRPRLNSVVADVLGKSFRDLVTDVYERFPDYSVNSVFRD
jgi:uncharacterized protein YwgA